jgi:hypothetical protein
LDADTEYRLAGIDQDGSRRTDVLVFRGRDLVRLEPGELYVARTSLTDPHGNVASTLRAISLDEISEEVCST